MITIIKSLAVMRYKDAPEVTIHSCCFPSVCVSMPVYVSAPTSALIAHRMHLNNLTHILRPVQGSTVSPPKLN